MKTKIWDLKPEGGGAPLLITKEDVDAREAIARDPERYSVDAPEGTVEHEQDKDRRAKSEALAAVAREENEALSKLNAERRDKIDAIRKEELEARTAEEERVRKEREDIEAKERLKNRQGDIDQVNQQAAQDEARIRQEFAAKRDEVMKAPAPVPEQPVDAADSQDIS